ncbi:hypothetical protein BDZ89DRAFT_196630 [Hymenopellis radicata]|nr:hypothetical protein BDZ89DRAFT_196630 [Hymenopellis radicata]
MPRMDGVAATSLIRRFNHSTVIVGMTSHVHPAAVMAYYAAGMNDVLTKPFGKEGLRTVLARHFGDPSRSRSRSRSRCRLTLI